MTAVGGEYNALFALDKALAQRTLGYAAQVRELTWQLPLELWHQQQCPSAYADTANSRPVRFNARPRYLFYIQLFKFTGQGVAPPAQPFCRFLFMAVGKLQSLLQYSTLELWSGFCQNIFFACI